MLSEGIILSEDIKGKISKIKSISKKSKKLLDDYIGNEIFASQLMGDNFPEDRIDEFNKVLEFIKNQSIITIIGILENKCEDSINIGTEENRKQILKNLTFH